MGLASLDGPPEYRGTRPCTFNLWLNTLSPELAATVTAALYRRPGDPLYWVTPALHEELVRAGWTGAESTTNKHRKRGACKQCR